MSLSIRLPGADGGSLDYQVSEARAFASVAGAPSSRIAFAAAHVVCDPLITSSHEAFANLDWDATLAYRRHLWSYGLGVAEAMDTAQRGMGLGWSIASKLIRLSLAEARTLPGARIACGAGTDHLIFNPSTTIDDVINAYEEQCAFIEQHGGQIILMASRALAACARTPDDYMRVYSRILRQVEQPVILHWLGDMFDPALYGYWGSSEIESAMQTCLGIIRDHAQKVDGIKISLLDRERERTMRRLLPEGVRMYTGDDFHYPEMLQGDEEGYSHALLGIFDAIAPAAAAALQALDAGDVVRYNAIFAPTVPLSRHIFQTPTVYYKAGVVFMAYLNGHQPHFRLVGGLENARSLLHYVELFKLANQAGLLLNPELAVTRMRQFLAVNGYA